MIGIRELRSDLAAHVRRAAGGEPTVVTVGGRPAAALVPLSAMSGERATGAHLSSPPGSPPGSPTGSPPGSSSGSASLVIPALVASGALVPPRRADGRVPDRYVTVWGNARLDRLLREIRG